MLNQNKPEGPIAIINSFIIYNPLDQQWARKRKKKKKRKGMGEKKKKTEKYIHSMVWFSLQNSVGAALPAPSIRELTLNKSLV